MTEAEPYTGFLWRAGYQIIRLENPTVQIVSPSPEQIAEWQAEDRAENLWLAAKVGAVSLVALLVAGAISVAAHIGGLAVLLGIVIGALAWAYYDGHRRIGPRW